MLLEESNLHLQTEFTCHWDVSRRRVAAAAVNYIARSMELVRVFTQSVEISDFLMSIDK